MKKIDFEPIALQDKALYERYPINSNERGCTISFTNLYLWGRQRFAVLHGHIALFSQFGNHSVYPYPLGDGDKRKVLDAIIADAKARGITCRITALDNLAKQTIEKIYPNKFRFYSNEGSYDYVYSIDDLAELKGKKYHGKRNHLKRFFETHPNYMVQPIGDNNIGKVKQFSNYWYRARLVENPNADFYMEQEALEKAFRDYRELGMEGLVLLNGEEILAFTIASRLSEDTFDVHFEKARSDIQGAYPAINYEFARYIRNKYSNVRYLDREEDMGIEGLRKAKQSYHPHHMIKKYTACLLEDEYNFDALNISDVDALRGVWKDAFRDNDDFLDAFFVTAFSTERARSVKVNGKIVGALYWFDCSYKEQRIAYLYAVATAERYRGRGLCSALMQDVHRHLSSLGYAGVMLVPGNEELFRFYERLGYSTCAYVSEFKCLASDGKTEIREIDADEYASLRKEFLPKNGVVQEYESISFLKTQATFYAGNNFLLVARREKDTLYGIELLGDTKKAPSIVKACGCADGWFRTPGPHKPFAMYRALSGERLLPPEYFGLAFD